MKSDTSNCSSLLISSDSVVGSDSLVSFSSSAGGVRCILFVDCSTLSSESGSEPPPPPPPLEPAPAADAPAPTAPEPLLITN